MGLAELGSGDEQHAVEVHPEGPPTTGLALTAEPSLDEKHSPEKEPKRGKAIGLAPTQSAPENQ